MAFNILIVDDSETIRAVLIKTLKMARIPLGEVIEAANGREALEKLKAGWVDIIFADINMPVMNGIEMIDEICADSNLKEIPVLVISTEGSKTRQDELLQKGVKGYIRKPFAPEQIRDSLIEILGGWDEECGDESADESRF